MSSLKRLANRSQKMAKEAERKGDGVKAPLQYLQTEQQKIQSAASRV